MKRILVHNISKGTLVGGQIYLAEDFWSRLRGLLGKKNLGFGEGLLLDPCKAVHSLGMGFSLEVIYLNQQNRVIHATILKPNRFSPYISNARQVLEVPLGTLSRTKTVIGDLFGTRTQLF